MPTSAREYTTGRCGHRPLQRKWLFVGFGDFRRTVNIIFAAHPKGCALQRIIANTPINYNFITLKPTEYFRRLVLQGRKKYEDKRTNTKAS